MFCTGGIRCEKATAYMKQQGFDEVYHLQGGILKYLEEVPKEQSLWRGECFVFDNRVAGEHDLKKGSCGQCQGCRHPNTEADQATPYYMKGVRRPRWESRLSGDRKRRVRERQKQRQSAPERP